MNDCNGLETLKARYPWPKTRPDVPRDYPDQYPDGWCCGQNVAMLQRLLGDRTRLIVELGSWLGRSAVVCLQAAPNATLICIDHWRGSAEHHIKSPWKLKLPTLYKTFLVNLWEYRERVVPLKADTVAGMTEVHSLGLQPELVYVDGAHDTPAVVRDITTAMELFPQAQICGDDWCHATVEAGVREAVADRAANIKEDYVCWWLEPKDVP